MQQNYVVEVVHDTATPGFYCHLFLVPNKSEGSRPVIDFSFLNFFQVTPTLDQYHIIKALICSFLLSQRGVSSYMADPARSLSIHRKTGSSWTTHCEAQHCIFQTLGFQCFNQQLVDTSFPHGRGGSPMVNVSTQCFEGSTS